MIFYIRIRGLPWNTSKKKISDFFLPVEIPDLSICIIKTSSGRDTGEALLKLEKKEDFDGCMEKHKEYLGTRYLELFEATAGEWTRLTGAESKLQPMAPASEKSSVLLLRGLPYGASEQHIRDFFEGIDILAVYLIKDHMGRASGHAYIELESEEILEQAMQKDKQYIDDRYIELFKSTVRDLMKALRKSQQNQEQVQNYFRLRPGHYASPNPMFGAAQVQKPSCIRMRGMPYNTTEAQIVNFFKEVKVTPSRIHRKADGSEAYIEFRSVEERDGAMSRQRAFIGNRYVDLFLIDYDVLSAKVGGGAQSVYGARPPPLAPAAINHLYQPHRSLFPSPYAGLLDQPYPTRASPSPARFPPAGYGYAHTPSHTPSPYGKGYGDKIGYATSVFDEPSSVFEDPAAARREYQLRKLNPYYGF